MKKINPDRILHILHEVLEHRLFKPIAISIIVSFIMFKGANYLKNFIEDQKESAAKNAYKAIKINIDNQNIELGQEQTINYQVKNGDTILKILSNNGVSEQDSFLILEEMKKVYSPQLINNGDIIVIKYKVNISYKNDKNNSSDNDISRQIIVNQINISKSPEEEIIVKRDAQNNYRAEIIRHELTKNIMKYSITINNSLFVDGTNAGVSENTMMNMINLYAYDVDFQRDIKEGDKFEILVESFYTKEGKKVKDGDVLFASLELSQRNIDIYLHKINGESQYFDANGNSTRKSLLRTPVNGARISSKFGMRNHPILGYTRMHKGVDFAAPIGTPILAAGAGTVVFMGPNGGYGNYVRIKHNADYQTAYAHISKFSSRFHKGSKVKQGDVIAYIGQTGLAKGAHLHFELLYKNSQINPSKVKSTPGIKLSGKELLKFKADKETIEKYRKNIANQAS
jgi:murein DD-endopeptidase MepM/ murein hydrolase activator NlpD